MSGGSGPREEVCEDLHLSTRSGILLTLAVAILALAVLVMRSVLKRTDGVFFELPLEVLLG